MLVWKWSVYPSNAEFEWRNKCLLSIRFWQVEVAYFMTNPFDQVLASLSFGRWVAMALVIESLNTSLDFFWGDAVVDSQIDRGHFEKPVRQTREKRRKEPKPLDEHRARTCLKTKDLKICSDDLQLFSWGKACFRGFSQDASTLDDGFKMSQGQPGLRMIPHSVFGHSRSHSTWTSFINLYHALLFNATVVGSSLDQVSNYLDVGFK